MADIVSTLLVRVDAEDNASAVLRNINGQLGNLQNTGATAANSIDSMTRATARSSTAQNTWAVGTQKAGKAIKEFGDDLDSVTKPLQVAAAGAVAGGVAVSKAAMSYETAFTKVKKTTNGTAEELETLDKDIKSLSDSIPVSSTELANLAAVGGQLGVKTGDIKKFTETMAAMSVATNLAGEEGASTMARFMNVMGEDIDNIDRVGSAIVELGNNTATTEAEIAYMAQRMGKAGKTVGMNTAQVLGYSAALSSMGIEAQLGGSAIGRTWLDIQTAVSTGGDSLQAYAKYAGVSAEQFKEQWSTDASGAFNGLIKGLSTTKDLTATMLELGIVNTQDQQIIMALAGGYDKMTEALNLSSGAYESNSALMKEAQTAYGTTSNQIKLAINDIQNAAINWGNVLLPEIREGAQWVGGIAEKFGNLDDGMKKSVVSGAKVAVVLGATSKAATSSIKTVGGVVEGIGSIREAFSAGGVFVKAAPALTKIAAAAGPVALGITAVAGAAVIGVKAHDAYQNAQINNSKRMEQTSSELLDLTSRYKELQSLQNEYNSLSDKINSGTLETADLDAAKARLDEIKQILTDKYKLNIDFGDVDKTVNSLKEATRFEMASKRSELLSTMESYGDDEYRTLNAQMAYDGFLIDFFSMDKTTPFEVMDTVIENCGKGEIYIDNYNIALVERIGSNTDARLELSRNLQSITIERDMSDLITRLYPYGYEDLHIGSVNNDVQYWRDIKPDYQGQPWCACFVTWCIEQIFGKENTTKLLRHYPYVYCPAMQSVFKLNSNPKRGDIVIFKRNGTFTHTGFVTGVDGDYFTTIEGNTSGGNTIVANGGGVHKKGYYNSSLPGTKFITLDWNVVTESEETDMTEKERQEFNALQTKVKELENIVDKLRTKTGYYNYIDANMNESYRPTIKKLADKGYLQGNEKGELMLTTDMMRILTILDRAGVFA